MVNWFSCYRPEFSGIYPRSIPKISENWLQPCAEIAPDYESTYQFTFWCSFAGVFQTETWYQIYTRAFVRTMDRAEIRIVCCRCFGTRWESVLDPRTILDYAPWPAKLSRNPLPPPRKPAAKIGKWCDWFVSLSWRGLLWIVIQRLQRFLNIFADLMSLKRQWSAWMTGSLLIYCW